jgi:hypothetical protein
MLATVARVVIAPVEAALNQAVVIEAELRRYQSLGSTVSLLTDVDVTEETVLLAQFRAILCVAPVLGAIGVVLHRWSRAITGKAS